jgi:hypothetical protein
MFSSSELPPARAQLTFRSLQQHAVHMLSQEWFLLSVVAGLLLLIVVQRGIWQFPLQRDQSSHIYVGQRVLAGELPYRSFIQFQPPGRLLISTTWAAIARVSGVNVVHVQRGYGILAGVGILIITAQVTRQSGGSTLAGILAAAFLFGLEGLMDDIVTGHALRLSLVLLFMLIVWLAQTRRWFRAGLATGAAISMWLPAGVLLPALVPVILLQRDGHRWRDLGWLVLGVFAVVVLVIAVLALAGILDDAVTQTLGGTVLYLGRNSAPRAGGAGIIAERLSENIDTMLHSYLAGESLLLLSLLVIPVLVLEYRSCILRLPRLAAPLLVLVLLAGCLFSLDRLGSQDFVILLPFLAVLLAWAVMKLAAGLTRIIPRVGMVFCAVVLGSAVLVYGLADRHKSYRSGELSLQDQHCMTDELAGVLGSENSVQSLDNLWYPVLSGQANATRYGWLGDKVSAAIKAQGMRMKDVQAEMENAKPAVIILNGATAFRFLPDYPGDRYQVVGNLTDAQAIYVRRDQREVLSLVQNWFSQNPDHPRCTRDQS